MKLKNKFFVTFLLSALLISNIQIISNAYEPDSSAPEVKKPVSYQYELCPDR